MLMARFVPVEKWPGKERKSWERRGSNFSAKYLDTLDLLERELFQLDAKNIVIQAYFDAREIRNDGWPKSSARPSQPGVIVTFESKGKGSLSFPCDTFQSWEDNLRAIALALEALRKVDRYGVTQNNEQYKGWAKLEAPSTGGMNAETSAYFIAGRAPGFHAPHILDSADVFRKAYLVAAQNCHPDRGGTHDLFVTLQQAKSILEKHHGIQNGGASA